MKATEFKMEKNDYGWKEYTAVVTNTTDNDFEYFTFNINLTDKDGITIETPSASTNNWTAGTKHKFTFSTDKKFDKINISKCDWNY